MLFVNKIIIVFYRIILLLIIILNIGFGLVVEWERRVYLVMNSDKYGGNI